MLPMQRAPGIRAHRDLGGGLRAYARKLPLRLLRRALCTRDYLYATEAFIHAKQKYDRQLIALQIPKTLHARIATLDARLQDPCISARKVMRNLAITAVLQALTADEYLQNTSVLRGAQALLRASNAQGRLSPDIDIGLAERFDDQSLDKMFTPVFNFASSYLKVLLECDDVKLQATKCQTMRDGSLSWFDVNSTIAGVFTSFRLEIRFATYIPASIIQRLYLFPDSSAQTAEFRCLTTEAIIAEKLIGLASYQNLLRLKQAQVPACTYVIDIVDHWGESTPARGVQIRDLTLTSAEARQLSNLAIGQPIEDPLKSLMTDFWSFRTTGTSAHLAPMESYLLTFDNLMKTCRWN